MEACYSELVLHWTYFSKSGIHLLICWLLILWVWTRIFVLVLNLRFNSYFNFSFKWEKISKLRVWQQSLVENRTLIISIESQVWNPGFQFPVSNPTQYFIFQGSKLLSPQKDRFLVYFQKPSVFYLLLLISTTGLGVVLMDGVGVGVGFSTFRTFKIFSSPVGTNLIMELSISSLSSTSYKYLLTLVLEDALSILLFFGLFLLKLKLKTSLNSYSFSLTKVNVAMNGKLDFSG